MSIIKDILNSRLAKNAVQEYQNGFNSYNNTVYTRNLDYEEYFKGLNQGGKYDNFYADSSAIVQRASSYPLYYTNKRGKVVEPKENTVAYYLDKPNKSFPQRKMLLMAYTEMITRGYTDIFLWRKDGKGETLIHDIDKPVKEDDYRGWTLVTGVKRHLSQLERKNIVRITYGASQANIFMGYSPTQAAQSWRKMQDEMGLHMTAFAKNAGMPIGQWVITASSPEEYVKIRDKLEEKTAGARNNGKVLYSYMPSEAKQAQISWVQFTSQDVQDYTNQLNFADKKMTQAFGVPGTIKGTNDGENYATASVSKQSYIENTIKPLVDEFAEQYIFAIEARFKLVGEIKYDVPIPELADESLIKVRTTTQQVALYDKKIAEGYTPESIVKAYSFPESFLLLERDTNFAPVIEETDSQEASNHIHDTTNELFRPYQNVFTPDERKDIESKIRKLTEAFALDVLKNGLKEKSRKDYKGKMTVLFGDNYEKHYQKNLEKVADKLVDTLGVVDIAELDLTPEERAYAVEQYGKRVDDFSKSFAKQVNDIPGKTLKARQLDAESNIERVVVNESEHTRIVSELNGWKKAEEDFPVRVTKTWKAIIDEKTCQVCRDLNGTSLDVTQLFINNPNVSEIYEVHGGMAHVNCRCLCLYEMEAEAVRKRS